MCVNSSNRGEEDVVLTPLVQYNSIGDDGARALAAAHQMNGSLTSLDISVRLMLSEGVGLAEAGD